MLQGGHQFEKKKIGTKTEPSGIPALMKTIQRDASSTVWMMWLNMKRS